MQLSERLRMTASFVTKGSVVADIGCDHAYTSIYLVMSGIARHVIATDINEGPVRIAKDNVKAHNMQKYIEVRQADGLGGLGKEDNVHTVLISGMGGNLIINILKTNDSVMACAGELVLQPQSDIYRVRHFLHDVGFMITKEKMLVENGKYYTIIKAVRGWQRYDNEYEYTYGKYLIDNRDDVFMEYLKKLCITNVGIMNTLTDKDSDSHIRRRRQLMEENRIISGILDEQLKGGTFNENG